MKRITKTTVILIGLATIGLSLFFASRHASRHLFAIYESRRSPVIVDRHGKLLFVGKNSLGAYAEYTEAVPDRFRQLLLAQEDRFFFFHPGMNPVSMIRALVLRFSAHPNLASSTITQQLVKLLLSQEQNRSVKNKLIEILYAVSLELHASKEDILLMYANSIHLGNNTQGIVSGSKLYFEKSPDALSDQELVTLISTIRSPSEFHPFRNGPKSYSLSLLRAVSSDIVPIGVFSSSEIKEKKEQFASAMTPSAGFEIARMQESCTMHCTTTIDRLLTEKIRSILLRHINQLSDQHVRHGAVVVLKLPENELLTIVGSPDPRETREGYQINMAEKPRPIGSTVKPFIYLKGFEKGLRPYTRVDDKEYRYTIGSGFAFYPKNYDLAYHGRVTLHYALTNSLNVPTIKVLEYVGFEAFSQFLEHDLKFRPLQPLSSYGLGIALGGLEMDLLHLSYFMTLFPNHGHLSPLKLSSDSRVTYKDFDRNAPIVAERFTQLMNKILSDRSTGIEQFGLKSSLNLPHKNYAVKTGTSREFHDSWTIGYTPDFLVGVWVGNSDNTPMNAVSGVIGAGDIWHDVMNLVYQSEYSRETPFIEDAITQFTEDEHIEYGLPDDDYLRVSALLIDDSLIEHPHDMDEFAWRPGMKISFIAHTSVSWLVNDAFAGEGKEWSFSPEKPGSYMVTAKQDERSERIQISITPES